MFLRSLRLCREDLAGLNYEITSWIYINWNENEELNRKDPAIWLRVCCLFIVYLKIRVNKCEEGKLEMRRRQWLMQQLSSEIKRHINNDAHQLSKITSFDYVTIVASMITSLEAGGDVTRGQVPLSTEYLFHNIYVRSLRFSLSTPVF